MEVYNKPIYSKKAGPRKIYIRQGSTNVLASDEEMRSLFAGARGGGENQPVEGKLSDLINGEKLNDYISRTGLKNVPFSNLQEKLKKLKAVQGSKLTIFGLITFGKEAILNTDTGLREERFILPEEAFREALANALAHRDYLIYSSCVNVDLYSDRIELSNPGESLVAIEDLERAPSKARNPSLIEFLKAYHITDKTARGIPTIYQAARKRGLLDPKFENISGDFKATLYFSSPHSGKDKEWVEAISAKFDLRDTQKNALVFVKNNGSISNKQYCELNHMNSRNDDKQARRELIKLLSAGILVKEGERSTTIYKLSDRILKD